MVYMGDMQVTTEALLPSQVACRSARRPERALLLAILEDAVWCALDPGRVRAQGRDTVKRAVHADAVAWIASDRTGLHTFRWVCDHLGLEPEAVREGLRRRQAPE